MRIDICARVLVADHLQASGVMETSVPAKYQTPTGTHASRLVKTTSVRRALQDGTRANHARLHELGVFQDLVNQKLSVERYRALVEMLYGFYEPLDLAILDGLNSLSVGLSPSDYQPRAPLLASDLADLSPEKGTPTSTPLCCSVPAMSSRDHVLGALYVAEGATLGGRVLYHCLDGVLGATQFAGRRYFHWCANRHPSFWARLNTVLEAERTSVVVVERLTEAANQTFAAMLHWFEDGLECEPPTVSTKTVDA